MKQMKYWALALALGVAACSRPVPPEAPRATTPASAARELVQKADAAAAAGDLIRAEQYLVSALRGSQDERALMKRLLVVCVASQRYAAAAMYAEQYLYRHPDDALIAQAAATLHLALGERARARTLLEDVIGERPEWPEPHFALASLLREDGARAAADAQDREYLRLAPRGPLAAQAQSRIERNP